MCRVLQPWSGGSLFQCALAGLRKRWERPIWGQNLATSKNFFSCSQYLILSAVVTWILVESLQQPICQLSANWNDLHMTFIWLHMTFITTGFQDLQTTSPGLVHVKVPYADPSENCWSLPKDLHCSPQGPTWIRSTGSLGPVVLALRDPNYTSLILTTPSCVTVCSYIFMSCDFGMGENQGPANSESVVISNYSLIIWFGRYLMFIQKVNQRLCLVLFVQKWSPHLYPATCLPLKLNHVRLA